MLAPPLCARFPSPARTFAPTRLLREAEQIRPRDVVMVARLALQQARVADTRHRIWTCFAVLGPIRILHPDRALSRRPPGATHP
jgi:hypothetical protein